MQYKIPYRNENTPFEINSEEDWKKIKVGWYVSYICNKCGERHVKRITSLRNIRNTCILIVPYRNKETPLEINSEEDWNKAKPGWYVSYICNKCNEKHVKKISNLRNIKNTCIEIPYRNKETPLEINSEEDWNKTKPKWYVSYICNKCGERHVKKISGLPSRKNTCIERMFKNKETPFEIKSEEDWCKTKTGWWVSYICNKCGEIHVKMITDLRSSKNTCIELPYRNKETPFEIKSEKDWKKAIQGWYVSYICNICGKRHVKQIVHLSTRKNTCIKGKFRNKETPFEIKSEEDWNKVKLGWYVSYICNTCGKRHVKRLSTLKYTNTCSNKTKNIKINYHSNYVDRFIFAF